MTGPNHWFYQRRPDHIPDLPTSPSVVFTTMMRSPATTTPCHLLQYPTAVIGSSAPSSSTITSTTTGTNNYYRQLMSPDSGRVSKPIRRRTRASRRTPTTLLNTDPANFRTVVQQFTGGVFSPAAGFINTNTNQAAAETPYLGMGSQGFQMNQLMGNIVNDVPPADNHDHQPMQLFASPSYLQPPGELLFTESTYLCGKWP